METLLLDVARRTGRYLDLKRERVAPISAALDALASVSDALPPGPVDVEAIVETLDTIGSPATMRSTSGRYFGFVNGGTLPAGLVAAMFVAAWDQNAALPVMSPAAARFDQIAADWIVELLGLPSSAEATFCGGASIANLTCLVAARDAIFDNLGWDSRHDGLMGAPRLRIVSTAETHVTIDRALRVAGIGRSAVETIPTDACGRAITNATPPLDDHTIVVLQAGNVNTGHSDPFAEIIAKAHDADAWVHVDGAFGLWAAASPSRRHLVEGIELADSWATDCHKWLNVPYDSGVSILRDPSTARRSMAAGAAYLTDDEGRAPMHQGLQMSQRARGVEAWATITSLGRSGVAALVDDLSDHAARLGRLLCSEGAELLAPAVLNQALVAFGDDATTEAVIEAVQADGRIWAGGTRWQGRSAMRLSVSSHATTDADVNLSAAVIIECWRSLTTRPPDAA
ncbi:MAG: aspartate aminotransferase family protein [Actinomycetia bacterium]|nr:aspartate aminotransferase family protein [Actinomycetes bacterium]MCP4958679.1 aspartate aminotransferase family protein [Actinomycetes bacterium]